MQLLEKNIGIEQKLNSLANVVFLWRDGRAVEGARLESVYTVKGIVGSNPTLSAKDVARLSKCS